VRDPYGLQLFRGARALCYQAEPIAYLA
jgi:hypothetical protein